MRKRTIAIITIVLLLIVILLLILFNSYLNSEEDRNLVQNVITNTNNSNIEANVNSSQEDVNTNNEIIDNNNLENANEEINNNENSEGGEEEMKLNIKIGDKNFTATLEDNATTREFINKLPLTINMSELHGNEKYYYFDESLPTNTERIRNINTGDLMLYGSDCLVLFYDSFSTSYSYTRLGHIDNPEGLANAVGSGNVEVTFEISNN